MSREKFILDIDHFIEQKVNMDSVERAAHLEQLYNTYSEVFMHKHSNPRATMVAEINKRIAVLKTIPF